MAFGSQRGFQYTTDEGDAYSIRADESNIELVHTSPPSAGTNQDGIPQDIRKRFIKLEAADGSTKRIPILTRARYDAITIGEAFAAPSVGEENPAGTSFVVTQKYPERIFRRVTALDTGKIDGDQP